MGRGKALAEIVNIGQRAKDFSDEFEEALRDLLKVAPPPKGDEPPPERPRRAKPSPRQPKQDAVEGRHWWRPSSVGGARVDSNHPSFRPCP